MNQSYINIYPNPVSGDLYIESKPTTKFSCSVQIFSLDGRLLKEDAIIEKSAEKIDFSGFVTGVYFVKLIFQKNIIVRRIIKE